MFDHPFSFNGRIGRLEWLISFVITVFLYIVLSLILGDSSTDRFSFPFFWIMPQLFLWAQGVKRCHDVNFNGAYILIPGFGFYLFFAKSVYKINKYGCSPKYQKELESDLMKKEDEEQVVTTENNEIDVNQ